MLINVHFRFPLMDLPNGWEMFDLLLFDIYEGWDLSS